MAGRRAAAMRGSKGLASSERFQARKGLQEDLRDDVYYVISTSRISRSALG